MDDTRPLDADAPLDPRDLVHRRRAQLVAAGIAHGVSNLRVFGSMARGETTGDGDIDFLVDLEPDRTLIDLAAFRDDAEDILGLPVDVATLDLLRTTSATKPFVPRSRSESQGATDLTMCRRPSGVDIPIVVRTCTARG